VKKYIALTLALFAAPLHAADLTIAQYKIYCKTLADMTDVVIENRLHGETAEQNYDRMLENLPEAYYPLAAHVINTVYSTDVQLIRRVEHDDVFVTCMSNRVAQ